MKYSQKVLSTILVLIAAEVRSDHGSIQDPRKCTTSQRWHPVNHDPFGMHRQPFESGSSPVLSAFSRRRAALSFLGVLIGAGAAASCFTPLSFSRNDFAACQISGKAGKALERREPADAASHNV